MRRSDLPPKLVQSFLTVLRMQSFTKAAQSLNLTQPAVTQHVARLEELLGVKLIERSRGVVLPTNHAQTLMPDFEQLERSVSLIFDKVRTLPQADREIVQIATPTSLVTYLLAPLFAELRQNGASVFPIFREVDDHRVYDMVRAKEVDFALTSMTGNDAALTCEFLLSDCPCVVFPSGHPLSGDGPIELDKIAPFDFIRPPPDTSANRMIEVFERELNLEFNFAAEASRLMTMEVMARSGLGLLILPELSARLSAHSRLEFRPINASIGWRTCQMIYHPQTRLSPLVKDLMKSIRLRSNSLWKDLPGFIALAETKT
ncbi:LysR family transcriptional regulator [Sulfitobacter mediterraneus]|uniref:LysR family transcriptional regulator n=1 Tax=Sulfitobacter mediterraneus TaxID=83219 RepID=UPI00193424A2|nr:LysR family transcriptional regulator [Sulfitobacter mediterraneus]MBM1311365.1 LysR family transcriptional regulator [Sulfitobacter mediterraneus]MBM1315247.1 LysR family transcriptional regulator [Sulfitobacter mediterraneus]MBM1323608.1 LysR family transcriptional regulator [Sulfitobacter mediterraneus]MBM1327520.1 LysR family transcriptional regulator [Sulfitobacter mediterraneus]MBM1398868.1 LysR family transcriptional regulator [Sulfitobacter mediterraneus]